VARVLEKSSTEGMRSALINLGMGSCNFEGRPLTRDDISLALQRFCGHKRLLDLGADVESSPDEGFYLSPVISFICI
jgi:hypothetical protein